jgi:hypothetical protein
MEHASMAHPTPHRIPQINERRDSLLSIVNRGQRIGTGTQANTAINPQFNRSHNHTLYPH